MTALRLLTGLADLLDRASRWLTVLGGLFLAAIMVTVTAGVVMRYVFNAPLLGINEIVQLTAVALVMAALPHTTSRGAHVTVDVFEGWLGRWGRLAGDMLAHGLSAFILVILAHRATLRAFDAFEFTDTTNMLRLPLWPFYALLATGAALCALIFAVQGLVILAKGGRE